MRLTPAQIAVYLICGEAPGWFSHTHPTLRERLPAGRAELVRLTGKDFAYDLAAWHAQLVKTDDGGYTWDGEDGALLKEIEGALASAERREAAASPG